jgi:hypothetical protein
MQDVPSCQSQSITPQLSALVTYKHMSSSLPSTRLLYLCAYSHLVQTWLASHLATSSGIVILPGALPVRAETLLRNIITLRNID